MNLIWSVCIFSLSFIDVRSASSSVIPNLTVPILAEIVCFGMKLSCSVRISSIPSACVISFTVWMGDSA